MTIVVYKQGLLCTDSFIIQNMHDHNLGIRGPKVYVDTTRRWMLAKDGFRPNASPEFTEYVRQIDKALIEFYAHDTPVGDTFGDYKIPSEIDPVGTIVMTKHHAFVLTREHKFIDADSLPFVAQGSGWIEATYKLMLGATPKEAIAHAINNCVTCGGEIYSYPQRKLLSFPKRKVSK